MVNRFRRTFKTLSAAFAVALTLLVAGPANAQDVQVFVDGSRVGFDQAPVLMDGRTLVPLRGVFEQMGATVVWDAAQRRVLANSGGTQVVLPIGSYTAYVDGQPLRLDVPAMIVNARTLVPLRFIAESLGAEVAWNAASRTVVINSGEAVGGGGNPPPGGGDRPDIDTIVISPQRTLKVGDTLRVIMTGDAGGQATFDVVGVRTAIPMAEVASGRYEGSLQVGSNLTANNAAVVVHLRKNGLESISQANTTVSFEGTANLLTSVDLEPNAPHRLGQTVTVTAYGSAGGTANMDVGGRLGIPMSEISSGVYRGTFVTAQGDANSRVAVNLRTSDGRTDTLQSTETIAFQGGMVYLNVTSPTAGQNVTGPITITGTTVPHATVEVTAQRSQELIPGVIGIGGDTLRRTTTADANGNFSLSLDPSGMAGNSDLDLSIVARDQYGNTSSAVEMELAMD